MRDYTETDGTVPQTEEFLGDQANKGGVSNVVGIVRRSLRVG
jgi:hypothetical protein